MTISGLKTEIILRIPAETAIRKIWGIGKIQNKNLNLLLKKINFGQGKRYLCG